MEDLGLIKRYNGQKFPASHAGNRGSIPRGVITFNDLANGILGLGTPYRRRNYNPNSSISV